MEDSIIQSKIRTIIEFCMDTVSAIWERKREDLIYKYSEIVQIGQIAFFLEALMRDKKFNLIEMKLFRALAARYGVYHIDTLISTYTDEGENKRIFINEEGKFVINFSSYSEVMEFCGKIWKKIDKTGLLDDNYQKNYISILCSAIIPKKIEDFKKTIKDRKILEEILFDCTTLGLLVFHERGFYYSPKLLKNCNEKTLDLLTKYNVTSNEVIAMVEKIQNSPAYPIESIDERIQEAIIEGAFKGILEPVSVKLPEGSSKYFVFANPKNLEHGNLSYETAAYFRFNEVYALIKYGRLEVPLKFLNKLISKGIAGDATNIGLNYFPLEVKGVIKVVEGSTTNKRRMMNLKSKTLIEAREILESDLNVHVDTIKKPPSWVSDPAGFRAIFSKSEKMKKGIIDLKDLLRDMA